MNEVNEQTLIYHRSEWIEANSKEIIDNIAYESVDVYTFLKGEFLKTSVNDNYLFQFIFRSFYRLDNAGLSSAFKTKYFELLEETRRNKELDFKKILNILYEYPNRKGQNTVQFSFATKMFNMIESSIPIYDKEVAKMFDLKRPYQTEFDSKLKIYLNHLDFIKKGYNVIIDKGLLPTTIKLFDAKFENNNLPKIKKIDFIFWSAGKVKTKINS